MCVSVQFFTVGTFWSVVLKLLGVEVSVREALYYVAMDSNGYAVGYKLFPAYVCLHFGDLAILKYAKLNIRSVH